MILEACCSDIESVYNAWKGGADRIELCSALEVGGVTPSIGLIQEAVKIFETGTHVLIRPRPGDFIYSPLELKVILRDIEEAFKAGAHGVVVGALTPDGDIDEEACYRMVEVAKGADITFHRAFDRCRMPLDSLERIIEMGFNRILTSGQKPKAVEGVDLLHQLIEKAGDRIAIMPGSGVTSDNAAEIVEKTGCKELHASCKKAVEDGGGGTRNITCEAEVAKLRNIVDKK